MPIVVASSTFGTTTQLATLIQSLLNDQPGNIFVLPSVAGGSVGAGQINLVPYINSAYRKVQRALENVGQESFIVDNVTVTVAKIAAADPSVQVSITDATAPPNQLPTDMLVPVRLWERPTGSTDNFKEMTDLTGHGGLPSRFQGFTLSVWEWRGDGLYFIGATQDTDVRIRYKKSYPDLTVGTDPVLLRNSQEAIAFFAAALAAAGRGSPLAEKYDTAGDDALEDLIRRAVHRDQFTNRRRRPYSYRVPYRPII